MAFIQSNSPTHCMTKGIHAVLSLFNLSKSCGVIIIWNSEPKEIKIYSWLTDFFTNRYHIRPDAIERYTVFIRISAQPRISVHPNAEKVNKHPPSNKRPPPTPPNQTQISTHPTPPT